MSFERALELTQVIFFLFVFLVLPFVSLAVPVYLVLYTSFWWLVGFYLVWLYYDWELITESCRAWEWMRNHKFWDSLANYFPMSLEKTMDLDPNRNYLFAWHPHGIISLSAVINVCTNGTKFVETYPGITRYLATLDMHFKQPFRRELIAAFGLVGASFKALVNVLSDANKGKAVVLVVGGAEEALECHPDIYKLCLERRKGFIRVALETGADLVPVYSFGETSTFKQVWNPVGSRLRTLQTKIKDIVGLSPVLAYGVAFIPHMPTIIPFRTKVVSVVGAPIRVERNQNPSREEVDELHKLYKTKLVELFESHKAKYGVPKDSHLEFY
ncbi:unnamed protein product [Bursaphelenchus okinawaensis]|uniref:Acyltransferase n=1 Tax=Bursaphelenchus okinawaensis TaxID=465554 RepID=A0A811L9R2_9BILA|nr:unnamed protein product [Bursaphelenchus okinawaensis]CAG9119823.1 unnamed protein product [Bursaphelenchus okinawaensis]